ncbi:MAG: hypothetical protein ACK5KP_09715 [Paludibacteraceae bacterium]
MKTWDLNTYGVQEMNVAEMREVNGGDGVKILVIKGLLDGKKGNTEIWLFGIKIVG